MPNDASISSARLTTAGLAVGSTAYMPPEQARGLDVDRRADLYSIGVLTWEMLVGRLPYSAGDITGFHVLRRAIDAGAALVRHAVAVVVDGIARLEGGGVHRAVRVVAVGRRRDVPGGRGAARRGGPARCPEACGREVSPAREGCCG